MDLNYWQIAKGLGITILDLLTGESQAFTIIDVDKNTGDLTIQRDKVELQTKLQYGADGYSVQCLNQDEQSYTYSRHCNGLTIQVLRMPKSPSSPAKYVAGTNQEVLPGRREYIDYTGIEIEKMNKPIKKA